MKLLFVIPSYNGGGAELVFIKLANQLSQSHDVSLFVINPEGHHKGRVDQSVTLIESKSRKSSRAWYELFQLCKLQTFDKVYATLVFPIILAGFVKMISNTKTRFIARPANIIQHERGKQRFIFALYLFFLGKFDKFIAQNSDIQKFIKTRYNKSAILLPNPVNLHALPEPSDIGENFIWVGRISYQKQYDLLVSACRANDAQVYAFVKPEEANTARQMCVDAGCANIHVFPFSTEIIRHLGLAKGLIITSRYEGLSNVMLEALSVGTPVITTRFKGGGHEFLNEGNSVYYETASQLAALLSSPPAFEARDKISSNIYASCSSEAVGKAYANI